MAVGSGAPDQGCADGPKVLADCGLLTRLASAGLAAEWLARMTAPRRMQDDDGLAITAALGKELAATATTEQLVHAHRRFVSIGGDHSAAVGLWSGVARATLPEGFGLIWIDAHMDSHAFATTPNRMIHGMPVACLLGQIGHQAHECRFR